MTLHLIDSLPGTLTPHTLLLSLTEQDLSEEDLTPGLLFLAAGVTLLSGVMMMDGCVEPSEIAYLEKLLGLCADTDIACHRLMTRLTSSIQQQQVYLDPRRFLVLCETLNMSQRLLLLGLGYEMAATDGHLNDREMMYLRSIAHRLQIDPKHMAVLEATFTHHPYLEIDALEEVFQYLEPSTFAADEPLFRWIAQAIHSNLPSLETAVGA